MPAAVQFRKFGVLKFELTISLQLDHIFGVT